MLPILVSVFILIVSGLFAWFVGPMLGIAGTTLLIFRILIMVLGAVAAGIILFIYFREKRRESATKKMVGGTELHNLLRDAEKHLATAQRTGPKSLDSLPLLYILGEGNAAKTTAVIKSGFDPELLGGQVYRDQDIIATPVVNLWYAHDCIFVEVGDAVRKAPALWNRLIRKTRPKTYRSAMGKQAPVRAAVVCVSSEQFLGATAGDAVLASGRTGNQMLRELSQQLGTEVPVYVILTKMDRIPYFSEFVRNLKDGEAAEPLGTAFQRNTVSSGLYAEKAMNEVTAALDTMFFSIGEFRTELLTREGDQRNVDPVYEFPREFRKLRNNLASYLVELTRPSHLNANPYLRGFYCTGVRSHMVEQMVADAARQPKAEAAGAGATRMFSMEQMKSVAAAQTSQTVTRKTAQWCFLPRIFPNVILEDRSALSGTSNSSRTHIFRRIAFGTLSLLLLGFLACLTLSWVNNSRLDSSIMAAANALPTEAVSPTALTSKEDLAALDQLRAAIVKLEDYRDNGAPTMYRFGLYHGNSVLEAARRIYFDRFRRLLLNNTQTNLLAALNALPPTPAAGADYSAAYDPLKAYLITTSNPDKSTPEFLVPVAMQYWENGRVPDTEDQKQLATAQFEFYSVELVKANPYTIAPDTLAVTKARSYLANFGGFERIYQSMLTAAEKKNPSIDFNRNFPGASATVMEGHVVPGAFSRDGYTFMQDAILHPDRYFTGEVWVLGDQAPPSLDKASVTQQLTSRYVTDFQTEWRNFLRSAQVRKYSGLKDAADKLQLLSNPNSPLLELLFTVSHNTLVGNQDITKEFQPAQALVAPDSPDRLMGQGNQGYITGLLGLQGAVAQVAASPVPNPDPATVAPIIAASTSAHTAASQAAQAFNLDAQAHVDQVVLALIQAPINSVDEVVKGRSAAVVNGGGGGLCSGFAQLTGKFPFNPSSTVDASAQDIAAQLQPGSGALWQFYDSTLKADLVQQGGNWVPAPNAPMHVNPEFVRFFNRAAQISAALYPAGGGSNGLAFGVHIVPSKEIQSVTFQVDAQRLSGSDVSKQFSWSLATSLQAQLTANYASGSTPPVQFSGPWAVFHLLGKGHFEQAGSIERVAFPFEFANTPIVVNGVPLVVRLELSGPNVNLLAPGGLNLHCVSKIAQ